MFRKIFRLGLMVVVSFGLVFVVACGKEKKRSQVQRRGSAQNKAGQATIEACQKEKKILSLDGSKCIAPEECKITSNMAEKNGKCDCKDGFSPDEKANSCIAKSSSSEKGEEGNSEVSQNKPQIPPKPETPPTGEQPGNSNTEAPLAALKSGQGVLNIQCTSQAHVDSLTIVVAASNGADLSLSYTMGSEVWFDEKTPKELVAAADAPAEAKLAKIEAICMKACAAVKFSVQPADKSMANASSLSGVFYGIPEKSCGEDSNAHGRPMSVSKNKPEIM